MNKYLNLCFLTVTFLYLGLVKNTTRILKVAVYVGSSPKQKTYIAFIKTDFCLVHVISFCLHSDDNHTEFFKMWIFNILVVALWYALTSPGTGKWLRLNLGIMQSLGAVPITALQWGSVMMRSHPEGELNLGSVLPNHVTSEF